MFQNNRSSFSGQRPPPQKKALSELLGKSIEVKPAKDGISLISEDNVVVHTAKRMSTRLANERNQPVYASSDDGRQQVYIQKQHTKDLADSVTSLKKVDQGSNNTMEYL